MIELRTLKGICLLFFNNDRKESYEEKELDSGQLKAELLSRHPELEYCVNEFDAAYQTLLECYKNGNKVLVAGNRGSAATASTSWAS